MDTKLRCAALALTVGASALLAAVPLHGHGGTYRGPGDTVPPPGGGGGGNGPPSPSPGPNQPSTPDGAFPGHPGVPGQSPGGGVGRPGNGRTTPGGTGGGIDLTAWTFWWEFNKAPYLNLKDKLYDVGPQTGDVLYLGRGARPDHAPTRRPEDSLIRTEVVPVLLATLEAEGDKDIVTGCLIALAKIGDEKREDGSSAFAALIAGHLDDPNQEISETAAVALGILAHRGSVDPLTQLLGDTPEGRALCGRNEVSNRTRAFAAYGLSLVASRTEDPDLRSRVVAALTDALRTDSSSSRDVKVACVVALGLAPAPHVLPPGFDPEETDVSELEPHASRLGQIEFLLAFLADEDEPTLVRAHAPTALVRLLGTREAFPALYDATRAKVAQALLAPLAKRSKAANELRQSAVLALGQLADNDGEEFDEELREAIAAAPEESSDIQTKRFSLIAAAQSAGRRGDGVDPGVGIEEAEKLLARALSSRNQDVRSWAGLSLGVLGHALAEQGTSVSPDLVLALRMTLEGEKNPDAFAALAIGAGLLRDIEAGPTLRDRFATSNSDEARGYAAVALGLLGDRQAIPALEATLDASRYRPTQLQQCAVALGLLGQKSVGPKLVAMLEDSTSLAVQAACASALGSIGDRDSVEPLLELLENGDQAKARAFAAVALGVVADKELLPWNSKIAVGLNYRAATETLNEPQNQGTGILNIL